MVLDIYTAVVLSLIFILLASHIIAAAEERKRKTEIIAAVMNVAAEILQGIAKGVEQYEQRSAARTKETERNEQSG